MHLSVFIPRSGDKDVMGPVGRRRKFCGDASDNNLISVVGEAHIRALDSEDQCDDPDEESCSWGLGSAEHPLDRVHWSRAKEGLELSRHQLDLD